MAGAYDVRAERPLWSGEVRALAVVRLLLKSAVHPTTDGQDDGQDAAEDQGEKGAASPHEPPHRDDAREPAQDDVAA